MGIYWRRLCVHISVLKNETHKRVRSVSLLELTDKGCMHKYLSLEMRPIKAINKKNTCYIVGFAVPIEYKAKAKEGEKLDICLELGRELKKQWNAKLIGIIMVVETLESGK